MHRATHALAALTLLALLALLACRGDAPAPAPAPASSVTPADALVLPLVELLHATPTTITVSSKVQNASISPEHLVDGDLQTAWNSRSGDLVGAWIELALPADATLHELRLTAGHAGTGPQGEDWFTMNVRIERVTVTRGATVLGPFALDVTRRDLQAIPLGDVRGGAPLRIRVDAGDLGSRPDWREVCVSELELWGTIPAALRHPEPPRVLVAE